MADVDSKNEVLEHERITLHVLWNYDRSKNDIDEKLRGELDQYFKKDSQPSEDSEWNEQNRAELIAALYLPASRIKFEYDNLLALAEERRLPSLTTYKCYEVKYFGRDGEECDQRWAYVSLLYSLQSAFVAGRLERRLRKATAQRLLKAGLGLIIVIIALHFALLAGNSAAVDPVLLMIVGLMGAIGAFFSRVATFQTNLSSLRFSDLTDSYQKWVLAVRLVYGCIGAIIFCYLMRSGLLSSSVFPDAQFWERPYATPLTPDGAFGKLTVASEWSKLLVWSFIAGFSERLVSSSLDKIGSK